ncbi:unnamed protein product, partial [Staurois parvus]
MLLCIALHSNTKQYVSLVKHTQHTLKNSTQHIGKPLIAPHVIPFLPSVISTVSVLFISTDHCISVTGDVSGSLSVTLQCQNAHRSPAI